MHAKKVLSDSKEKKKQAKNLRVLVDFKKKKDRLQVFYYYHEAKLLCVYFNHVSCINIFILKAQ
jgi:hypothetical protein